MISLYLSYSLLVICDFTELSPEWLRKVFAEAGPVPKPDKQRA